MPIPESIVEAEVHSHLEGEGRLEDDEHRAEVGESTRKGLKTQLVLDAIAEKEEVKVEQQELIEFLVMSSQQYGMDPNQFAQSLDQEGQIPAMVAEVARRKALATVLEKVAVKDTAGNAIDLNEAVPAPRTTRPRREAEVVEADGLRGGRRGGGEGRRLTVPSTSPRGRLRRRRPARPAPGAFAGCPRDGAGTTPVAAVRRHASLTREPDMSSTDESGAGMADTAVSSTDADGTNVPARAPDRP